MCGSEFEVTSPRRLYCTSSCRDRMRYRNNPEKKREASKAARRKKGIFKASQPEIPNSIWRTFPRDERYEISNMGQVRYKPHGTIRKLSVAKNGYLLLCTRVRGKAKAYYVHRAVIETFRGSIQSDLQVCHNNGDKSDNRLENLRVDTVSGNAFDKFRHGTMVMGEMHIWHKLTAEQVQQIRLSSDSHEALAKRYGVSRGCIGHVTRRETWKQIV